MINIFKVVHKEFFLQPSYSPKPLQNILQYYTMQQKHFL